MPGVEVIDLTEDSDESRRVGEWVDGDDAGATAEDVAKLAELRGRRWVDADFGATRRSIEGDDENTPRAKASSTGEVPMCRCGKVARMATVASKTANEGRAYYHCERRSCGFFAWADGGESVAKSRRELGWSREWSMELVTDYGFGTELSQGALGDCWMLSALSVVARRFDLLARLFVSTERGEAYGVRFFVDGRWETFYVDSALPVSKKNGELAFVKSYCAASGAQTGWASVVEKAYAKSCGSYAALSGGQIAEALRALTGAATVSLEIGADASFDELDDLFRLLERWKKSDDLPMGCGTDFETADGLHGCHAYSILAIRSYPEGRVVWVRDPHGVSQFPRRGAIATRVAERLAARGGARDECDRAIVATGADGTFFVDFASFAAAFSRVDVALAWRAGTHAKSFEFAFPSRKSSTRSCAGRVCLASHPTQTATVAVSAIQPTRRGAWCRSDRKKSYKPGDVSLVVRVDGVVVAASIAGAEVGDFASALVFRLPPGSRQCEVFAFSLGKNPAAAAVIDAQPFVVRVDSDRPLRVSGESRGRAEDAVAALHEALAAPPRPLFCTKTPSRTKLVTLAADVSCRVFTSDGLCAVVALNASARAATVAVAAFAKSAVARADDTHLIKGDEAADYKGGGPDPGHFKWPAKWRKFAAFGSVPARSTRLLLVVVRSGVQWRLGDVRCTLDADAAKKQATLDSWAGGSSKRGVFDSYPYAPPPVRPPDTKNKRPREDQQPPHHRVESEDDQLRRALELSLQEQRRRSSSDDADLRAALELSRRDAGPPLSPAADPQKSKRDALAQALARRGL